MDIKEAIQHCREVAAGHTEQGKCSECAAEHNQLADWLEELVAYKSIGLMPEEVNAIKNALMGREIAKIKEFDGVSINRLQELVKAEKNRRLVVLTRNKVQWIKAILAERERQDQKWGYPQENTYCEWASILAEEVGELAKELNELNFGRGDPEKMTDEAIQVAAVALAILEQQDIAHEITQRIAFALGRSCIPTPEN